MKKELDRASHETFCTQAMFSPIMGKDLSLYEGVLWLRVTYMSLKINLKDDKGMKDIEDKVLSNSRKYRDIIEHRLCMITNREALLESQCSLLEDKNEQSVQENDLFHA